MKDKPYLGASDAPSVRGTLRDDEELEGELNPDTWAGYDLPEEYKSQLPWFNEILWDKELHEYSGFNFRVIRMDWGAWNGYVFIPKGHPLHGKTYMDHQEIGELIVHGGITYTASGEDDWILGFDTSHGYDFSPNRKCRSFEEFTREIKNYKTHEYVVKEAKLLIDNIRRTYGT